MSAVRVVMVLWGGLFLVLGLLAPPSDGDLWWQRWLGDLILRTHQIPTTLGSETFTAAGAPWVPQEWLFSVIVAVAMPSGLFALVKVGMALVAIAVLVSVYARARSRATPEAIAFGLLFCGVALTGSFGVRAQVLGWGCFALFLLFLNRRDGWFYLAFPTVILWANLHASVVLAPVFLAARIIGAVADDGLGELRVDRTLRLLPLVILGLFCTPLTWHLPAYAVMLSVSPIRHYIQEWQPVSVFEPDFLFGALPLALAIAIGGIGIAWRNKAESLPILALFVAMLMARRNEALFAIAAAPLAAASLERRFPRLSGTGRRFAGAERFAIIAACIAFAITGAAFETIKRQAPPILPVAALSHLAATGTPQRLFCQDFSYCSVALSYPNLRVFIDGRCDPYPLGVWSSYLSVVRTEPSWSSTLNRYGVSAVVVPRGSKLASAMAGAASWHVAYSDRAFLVYRRT